MQSRSWVNPKLRNLVLEADAAARRGELDAGLRSYIDAGDWAVTLEKWRSAARCYRSALELDVQRREPIDRLLAIARRTGHEREWTEYARFLDEPRGWSTFGCRSARIVTNDSGSVVECTKTGPVIELLMTTADLVEAYPTPRFANMPVALGLLILRRALWIDPQLETTRPARVRVAFGGRPPRWLDERGDWQSD